jgi:hypothetical protein
MPAVAVAAVWCVRCTAHCAVLASELQRRVVAREQLAQDIFALHDGRTWNPHAPLYMYGIFVHIYTYKVISLSLTFQQPALLLTVFLLI